MPFEPPPPPPMVSTFLSSVQFAGTVQLVPEVRMTTISAIVVSD
jgi:hypothetical protein